MSKLSTATRNELKPEDFAVPGKRKLPIHDKGHVKAAWDLLPRTKGLTDEEITEARKRILARAKKFGMDTSGWKLPSSSREPGEKKKALAKKVSEHMQTKRDK